MVLQLCSCNHSKRRKTIIYKRVGTCSQLRTLQLVVTLDVMLLDILVFFDTPCIGEIYSNINDFYFNKLTMVPHNFNKQVYALFCPHRKPLQLNGIGGRGAIVVVLSLRKQSFRLPVLNYVHVNVSFINKHQEGNNQLLLNSTPYLSQLTLR